MVLLQVTCYPLFGWEKNRYLTLYFTNWTVSLVRILQSHIKLQLTQNILFLLLDIQKMPFTLGEFLMQKQNLSKSSKKGLQGKINRLLRSTGHYSWRDGINLLQFVCALSYSCLKDSFNVQSILFKVINPFISHSSNETSSPFIFKGDEFIHHSLVCSCLKTGSGFPVVTYFACDSTKYLRENVLSYTLFNLKVRKLILVTGDLAFLCASGTS